MLKERLRVDFERLNYRVGCGAQLSDRVASLVKEAQKLCLMTAVPADLLVVGCLTAVYGPGLKGWLKVYSYTDPMENLFDYKTCLVHRQGQWQPVEIEAGRPHGKGLVLKLRGVDNPELGATYASWRSGGTAFRVAGAAAG